MGDGAIISALAGVIEAVTLILSKLAKPIHIARFIISSPQSKGRLYSRRESSPRGLHHFFLAMLILPREAVPSWSSLARFPPLVAIAEGFDMTTPYGRAMAQMASVFAELERAMIRERTRIAKSVKRSRGERISGHAPFGTDFGPDGRLEVIARMRQLREEGLSYRGIAARLDDEGILPKRGRRWIHTTVKSILTRDAA
jgi:hypothetical protein